MDIDFVFLPSIEDELDPIPKEWSTSDEAGNSIGTSKTMGTFLVQLLSVLVQWVPHSVNDDTFHCLLLFDWCWKGGKVL